MVETSGTYPLCLSCKKRFHKKVFITPVVCRYCYEGVLNRRPPKACHVQFVQAIINIRQDAEVYIQQSAEVILEMKRREHRPNSICVQGVV